MSLRTHLWLRLATLAVALPLFFVQFAQAEMRAIWIWGSTVESVGADTAAAKLQAQGITDAFLLVKGLGGTAYYASTIAPRASTNDTLGNFITACHSRGIRVHAWLSYNEDDYFAAKNKYAYTLYHANKLASSSPYPMNDGRICPLRAQEAYNQYFFSIVDEILRNYHVDGIHLDSMRYGHALYCFCPAHLALAAKLGIDMDHVRKLLLQTYYSPADGDSYFDAYAASDPDVTKWIEERESEINLVVKGVRDRVNLFNAKNRAEIALSAALMPDGAVSYLTTDAARSDQVADAHYAQNYKLMSPMLSFIAPMAYFLDYGKKPAWVGDVVAGAIEKAGRTPVVAGIQTYSSVTPQNIVDEISAGRLNGSVGFNLFQYATTSDTEWSAIVPTLDKLVASTQAARASGLIDNDGIANSLLKKLEAAQDFADQSNTRAEESKLQDYLRELNALRGRHIDAKEAQLLADDAEWLLDLINPDEFSRRHEPWEQYPGMFPAMNQEIWMK